jgi:hypothetical protein
MQEESHHHHQQKIKNGRNHWKERQAVMAVALSLATYLYNSVLSGPASALISHRIGRDEPVLQISTGAIRGKYGVSREGREFVEFLGIPFAKPPINELRFEVLQQLHTLNAVK